MNSDQITGRRFRHAFLILSAILAFATASVAQTGEPPKPTQTPAAEGLPAVVSRDEDIEKLIRERTAKTDDQVLTDTQATGEAKDKGLDLDSLSVKQQQKLLLYLDILTKLEQRAESLRSQLIDLTEKENTIATKLQQVEYNLRPEVIESFTALSGSLRPEVLRDQRRADLGIEKKNYESLLSQIEASRSSLETNLRRADELAEKMRTRFETAIDAALGEDSP